MDDDNELSPAERMAMRARQVGPAGELSPPRLKMISFRVPYSLVASVDALASVTAQSRNSAMTELLQVGISAVINELDDLEQFEAAREHFSEKYSDSEE